MLGPDRISTFPAFRKGLRCASVSDRSGNPTGDLFASRDAGESWRIPPGAVQSQDRPCQPFSAPANQAMAYQIEIVPAAQKIPATG
ncbi:hypothetical protein GCM10023063_25810 [Arthrobacter methylotrophus]